MSSHVAHLFTALFGLASDSSPSAASPCWQDRDRCPDPTPDPSPISPNKASPVAKGTKSHPNTGFAIVSLNDDFLVFYLKLSEAVLDDGIDGDGSWSKLLGGFQQLSLAEGASEEPSLTFLRSETEKLDKDAYWSYWWDPEDVVRVVALVS